MNKTIPSQTGSHPASNPVSFGEKAEVAFAQLLVDASRRGFHGSVSLTLVVQDGHIQHMRLATEQMMK